METKLPYRIQLLINDYCVKMEYDPCQTYLDVIELLQDLPLIDQHPKYVDIYKFNIIELGSVYLGFHYLKDTDEIDLTTVRELDRTESPAWKYTYNLLRPNILTQILPDYQIGIETPIVIEFDSFEDLLNSKLIQGLHSKTNVNFINLSISVDDDTVFLYHKFSDGRSYVIGTLQSTDYVNHLPEWKQ